MTGYLDNVIRPLVLILSKMSGYVKTFKDKSKDKNENNKLMSLHIDIFLLILINGYYKYCIMVELI